MQKNQTWPLSHTIHKDQLQMGEDLNVRQESIKILEGNTASNLFDLGLSNFLLDLPPKARETKAKMNYWDFIKINTFAQQRKQATKPKTTDRMGENICK